MPKDPSRTIEDIKRDLDEAILCGMGWINQCMVHGEEYANSLYGPLEENDERVKNLLEELRGLLP